ncbi:MAG TPA: alpha/beta hydrolase [Vicinamibacterales bacterium]|nr:alpha/beta hydrolase [Vicinamibacterales bacterium]
MRRRAAFGGAVLAGFCGMVIAWTASQAPPVRSVDENVLREYTGVYRWEPDAFVYLQLWHEFSGFGKPGQLVAFDESGQVRTLYPSDRDRFVAGPGAAISTSIESRIEFQRDGSGRITSLTWARAGAPLRTAQRAEIERHEEVRFSSGEVQLAGTLITPSTGGKHPAIVLVHGSGPEDREFVMPFARFLVRRGVALLGYDKRGVGGSTGDWQAASFDDLARDVVAAFEYLKTRSDIDPAQIGMVGVSQAGWIMPLAAVRAKDLAFLISVSGGGVTPAETTIDQARHEMTVAGMKAETIEQIVQVMKLQYEFARTGEGWDGYAAARQKLAARIGRPPDSFPETPDHPSWHAIRRLYFHDPAPTLRQLRLPVLALFAELDGNIVAEKNKAAWEAALKAGGNRDYTLLTLPGATHLMLEASARGPLDNASSQRFVPAYFSTIREWLARRLS